MFKCQCKLKDILTGVSPKGAPGHLQHMQY